jgi:hypothetical protein
MAQYDFTPDLKARILAKIKAVQSPGRPQLVCSACGHWDWYMADGIANVPLLWNAWTGHSKSNLPCAALVCLTCGNTLFFNLVALGFALDIGPDMDELRKQWSPK